MNGRCIPLVTRRKMCKIVYNESKVFFIFTGCKASPGFLNLIVGSVICQMFCQIISDTRVVHELKYNAIRLECSNLALSTRLNNVKTRMSKIVRVLYL